MKRADVEVTNDKIVIHPEKLATMMKRHKEAFGAKGWDALFHQVLDEEMDAFVEQAAAEELAEQFAFEIRAKLEAGQA